MIGGRLAQEQADSFLGLQAGRQPGDRSQDLPAAFDVTGLICINPGETIRDVRQNGGHLPESSHHRTMDQRHGGLVGGLKEFPACLQIIKAIRHDLGLSEKGRQVI